MVGQRTARFRPKGGASGLGLSAIAPCPARERSLLDFVGADLDPAGFDPSDFALNLANVRNTSLDG